MKKQTNPSLIDFVINAYYFSEGLKALEKLGDYCRGGRRKEIHGTKQFDKKHEETWDFRDRMSQLFLSYVMIWVEVCPEKIC